jgi:hypothetical protein
MNESAAAPSAGQSLENPAAATATPEMAELEADIARLREELASTVGQLTAKLDVKARVRNRATAAKDATTFQLESAREQLLDASRQPRVVAGSIGAGVLAAMAAFVLVRLGQRRAGSRTRRWRG